MERHEDLVLRPPRVGGVDRLDVGDDPLAGLLVPVDLAVVDEVRPAVAEALGEHRLPVLPRVRGAEQRGAQRLVAVDGADDEVVPRLAIEVDDDGVEAERLRDRGGDRLERARQLVGALDRARGVELRVQSGEGRERAALPRRVAGRGLRDGVGHRVVAVGLEQLGLQRRDDRGVELGAGAGVELGAASAARIARR